jgi:hypothetical protein
MGLVKKAVHMAAEIILAKLYSRIVRIENI